MSHHDRAFDSALAYHQHIADGITTAHGHLTAAGLAADVADAARSEAIARDIEQAREDRNEGIVTEPDLFTFAEAERTEQRRTEWLAKFERADWTVPWDTTSHLAGDTILGWRCPDPDCGVVEPSMYALAAGHGLDPSTPSQHTGPDEPWCRYVSFQTERVVEHGLPWIRKPGDDRPRPTPRDPGGTVTHNEMHSDERKTADEIGTDKNRR